MELCRGTLQPSPSMYVCMWVESPKEAEHGYAEQAYIKSSRGTTEMAGWVGGLGLLAG